MHTGSYLEFVDYIMVAAKNFCDDDVPPVNYKSRTKYTKKYVVERFFISEGPLEEGIYASVSFIRSCSQFVSFGIEYR